MVRTQYHFHMAFHQEGCTLPASVPSVVQELKERRQPCSKREQVTNVGYRDALCEGMALQATSIEFLHDGS